MWYRADLEQRTEKGNMAYLLASGTGVTDVVEALIECRADINATNDRGLGAYQSASASSATTRNMFARHGVARPNEEVASARQWSGWSASRQTRRALAGWEESGWEE